MLSLTNSILAKKATGKSREEAQKEKKQELQKQLDIVQGQLEKQGSAKKPTKQKGKLHIKFLK